jgi:hypothetical protein
MAMRPAAKMPVLYSFLTGKAPAALLFVALGEAADADVPVLGVEVAVAEALVVELGAV